MFRAGLVLVLVLFANPLMAGSLEVCVENPARLDEYTVQAFRSELALILAASGRPHEFGPCRSGVVRITLREQPPPEEPSALGRTRYRDGRLVPEIELFAGPVAQIVGTHLPGVLGRALARVATHELGHWLTQDSGHAATGVMMERLTAGYLMAPSHGFFRLPAEETRR